MQWRALVQHWWPIPAMFAAVVTVQVIWMGRYHVTGHASGHLSNATVVFGVAFVLAVTVWALPAELRARPELWVLIVAIMGGALLDSYGNIQVVDAIGADNWSMEQADLLGGARVGFNSGHDLAQAGSYVVVLSSVLLAAWMWWRHAVGVWVAVAAAALSIVIPAWIFPGAGMVVLAVASCVRRARRSP